MNSWAGYNDGSGWRMGATGRGVRGPAVALPRTDDGRHRSRRQVEREARTAGADIAAVVYNYNYARFVGDAIESVLDQREPFDEVIVVDDGSTDDSLGVMRRYEPAVRLVTKENGGALSACLAGFAASTATYVYFLDADDLAAPDLVEKVRPRLATRPMKVQFPLRSVDADGRQTGSVFPTVPEGYDAAMMREDNRTQGFYVCPPTSGNVYHRSMLDEVACADFDPREDCDGTLALMVPYRGDIVALNEPLARYRVHGDNKDQYFVPTPSRLRDELDRFDRRWAQLCTLSGWAAPPFGAQQPGYVRERELMLAALEGYRWIGREVVGYASALARSNLPLPQRVALTAWAAALTAPVQPWRERLIASRRSPAARPGALQRAVRLLRYATTRA